jgi:hypothetical protein
VYIVTNSAAEVALHDPPKKPDVFSLYGISQTAHSFGSLTCKNLYNAIALSGYVSARKGVFAAK